jgi:hypothetical protein
VVRRALRGDFPANRSSTEADIESHRQRGDGAHESGQDAPAIAQTLIARDHDARVDAAGVRDPPIRT